MKRKPCDKCGRMTFSPQRKKKDGKVLTLCAECLFDMAAAEDNPD